MNRTILSVFALASIFFLFGSLVAAETGSGSTTDADKLSEKELKKLKELQIKQMKAKLAVMREIKEFSEESDDETKVRIEARSRMPADAAIAARRIPTLPAWANDSAKEALSSFGLDKVTLEKLQTLSAEERELALKELKIRYELKENSEERMEIKLRLEKVSSRLAEIADAYKLDAAAKYLKRLEIAIQVAEENGDTELVAKLTALKERLKAKKELSTSEKKEVDDSVLENRIADFK
jgi:hypothetical protein